MNWEWGWMGINFYPFIPIPHSSAMPWNLKGQWQMPNLNSKQDFDVNDFGYFKSFRMYFFNPPIHLNPFTEHIVKIKNIWIIGRSLSLFIFNWGWRPWLSRHYHLQGTLNGKISYMLTLTSLTRWHYGWLLNKINLPGPLYLEDRTSMIIA